MGNERITRTPRGVAGTAAVVLTAIAGLVGAATPGFLAWKEDAGAKAKLSQEAAELADAKAETSYEVLFTQIQAIKEQREEDHEDLRDLRAFCMDMVKYPEQVIGVTSRKSRGGGKALGTTESKELLDDPLSDLESTLLSPVQIQMPLPEDLDNVAQQRLEQRKQKVKNK